VALERQAAAPARHVEPGAKVEEAVLNEATVHMASHAAALNEP